MKHLVLAVMVVFSLNAVIAQTPKKTDPKVAVQTKELKIAYVNSQKLIDSLPSYLSAKKELERIRQEGSIELEEMYKAYQAALAVYEQKKPTLIPIQIKFEEEKLMKREQDINTADQQLNEQLQAVAESLNKPIIDRVTQAIEIVCQRDKITYVLEEVQLLYYKGGTSIQDAVKVELFKLDAQAMIK